MSEEQELDFYLVRNKEGKWFRRKGYGGSGESWVEDIKKARAFGRIGPARATVTFFTSKWPEYGVPDIVHFKAKIAGILDEADRVSLSQKAKMEKTHKYEAQMAQHRLDAAKRDLEAAEKRLAEAKKWSPRPQ